MDKENRPIATRKRGRPKTRPDDAVVVYTRVASLTHEYLLRTARETGKPVSDIVALAIDLLKNNGVIIIRGDHAATPAPDGD